MVAAGCVGLIAIGLAGLVLLERMVEGRFSGQLFALPSRIYSRPLRLAPGMEIERTALIERLRERGYQPAPGPQIGPGEYAAGRRTLEIGRRGFLAQPEERLLLRLADDGEILRISDRQGFQLREALIEPEMIAEIHGSRRERRKLISLDEAPQHLIDAVIQIEDRHFFEHSGLDFRRIGGALVANLRAGRIVQGGSTIAQQLVKNLFLSPDRTLARKSQEAIMALILESRHDKREILEAYLNAIYLGQSGSVAIHGVGAGARHYFGKEIWELSVAEAALLAGMIAAPARYSPFQNREASLARRNLVLGLLHEREILSEARYLSALAEELQLVAPRSSDSLAPYFVDHLRRTLPEPLDDEALQRRGLAIISTLDPVLQRLANRAITRGLQRIERDYAGFARPESPLQAALVAFDPESGEIVALVGGRDYAESQFNRATQARRQPGSVFKPVVALAALSRENEERPRFTLASWLEDAELVVESEDEDEAWRPVNFDGQFRGRVTVREAIERSLNVPMARLGLAVGPERVVATARRMGIESTLRPVPSLALGSFEVSLLEMSRAYGVLAAGGRSSQPRAYSEIRDAQGEVIDRTSPRTEEKFSKAETYLVTSALIGAVEEGTGRSLGRLGLKAQIAGKTGTTNGFRDAWFIGYTPRLVAGVWVGFDDGASLGLPASVIALPIFGDFMQAALHTAPPARFDPPLGVAVARVNRESGLRAGPGCSGEREVFLAGTAPDGLCVGPAWKTAMRGLRWLRRVLGEP